MTTDSRVTNANSLAAQFMKSLMVQDSKPVQLLRRTMDALDEELENLVAVLQEGHEGSRPGIVFSVEKTSQSDAQDKNVAAINLKLTVGCYPVMLQLRAIATDENLILSFYEMGPDSKADTALARITLKEETCAESGPEYRSFCEAVAGATYTVYKQLCKRMDDLRPAVSGPSPRGR